MGINFETKLEGGGGVSHTSLEATARLYARIPQMSFYSITERVLACSLVERYGDESIGTVFSKLIEVNHSILFNLGSPLESTYTAPYINK